MAIGMGRTCWRPAVVVGMALHAAIGGQPSRSNTQGPVYPIRFGRDVTLEERSSVEREGGTDGLALIGQRVTVGPKEMRGIWGLAPVPIPTDPGIVAGRDESAVCFRFEDCEGRLTVYEGDGPVMSYVHIPSLAKGVPEDRRRSSYIHPLYGLDGEMLTDDFPLDHFHHRGVFWGWPQVKIEDQTYDHWHIKGIDTQFEGWVAKEAGPICAVLGVRNTWRVKDRAVVQETSWYQIFRAGARFRFIDVIGTIEALDGPVILGGKPKAGYGSFNIRAGPRKQTMLTTDRGRLSKDDSLTPFEWADLSARFDGRDETSGMALFPQVGNPDLPTGWTLRHYGFLGVAWPGLGYHTITADRPLTLRYRLAIHRGSAEEANLEDAYRAYQRRRNGVTGGR